MVANTQFFCPLWGSESLPFETFLAKVKQAGYDGVEMGLPLDAIERDGLVSAIRSHDLLLIAQHWETVDIDLQTHLGNYTRRLYNLAAVGPLFINSQTGKDYYSMEQNGKLIAAATEIEVATGIPIIHETHRGKFSFAAHITRKYLERYPDMNICLDISHWCCVAETLLEDQADAVQTAIQHTHHIHSRVGFQEGPQVMDPRAPEWAAIVGAHITWWQRVVDHRKALGKQTTITTEFGPFPYLQRLPYTKNPIYDQWEANIFMLDLLRKELS